MIEHWNPYLRPFVHHVLAGDGSTDRALSAAYVRAYRALPRYDASQKPGLWLHRIAYLAATDELRRVTRDPVRRRALADVGRAEAGTDAPRHHAGLSTHDAHHLSTIDLTGSDELLLLDFATDQDAEADAGADELEGAIVEARGLMALDPDADDHASLPPGWRRLAPDQRALAVLVDLEGHRLADAARALDASTAAAADRLEATRRLLSRSSGGPTDTDPTGDRPEVVATARAALAAIPVPAPDPRFWSVLGRRLLAERASPAAPAIDPLERLARVHPAEPGFAPRSGARPSTTHPGPDPVQGLAERADWVKPPRGRRHLALAALAVVAVAVLVAAAVRIGTSSRIPDGSRAAADVVADVGPAMAAGPYREVIAVVTDEDPNGRQTERRYTVIQGGDGSWVVSNQTTIDQTTYDATTGLVRRVAVVGEGELAEVFATDATGLAAGAPDDAGHVPVPLDDLTAVPSILRAADQIRMPRSTVAGEPVYTLTRELPTGAQGASEAWRIRISAATSLPVEIVRSRDGRIVRHIGITSWTTATEVPAGTFLQPVPPEARASAEDRGFATTDLAAVPLLGRGEAVTPTWLPAGFELAVVAVRSEAPAGSPTTGEGANPPDVAVLSLGYQHGAQRITVTTRAAGTDPTAWTSPFPPGPGPEATERTVGDGRFNGARVEVRTDERGRAQLWGVSGDSVFTVAGDLTPDQAHRVAASLR
jgi:DNA-directed RNA polymerase specialized sigma24 family protein